MRCKQSLPLLAAHLAVSSTCSCSCLAFVASSHPTGLHDLTGRIDSTPAISRRTRLCGKRWRYDSPLENHIRVDDDESDDGTNYSSNSRASADDGRPHGYRDSSAVLEMPNNVYIDRDFHGNNAGRSPCKKSNEIDPPEAYQVLGLPDGCTDKATIKTAYYDLVAKHHPDHNKWMDEEEQREAREKLYKINAAFGCIKSALRKRPKLRPGFGMPGMSSGGGGNWYEDNRNNSSYFGY
mmetsp:Transcript_28046/g.81064  ORF Transcript_28046/g.81064 Transcript_28046/m.81064 type:complete len:237 (+) Transcript_28046:127-837(+)